MSWGPDLSISPRRQVAGGRGNNYCSCNFPCLQELPLSPQLKNQSSRLHPIPPSGTFRSLRAMQSTHLTWKQTANNTLKDEAAVNRKQNTSGTQLRKRLKCHMKAFSVTMNKTSLIIFYFLPRVIWKKKSCGSSICRISFTGIHLKSVGTDLLPGISLSLLVRGDDI